MLTLPTWDTRVEARAQIKYYFTQEWWGPPPAPSSGPLSLNIEVESIHRVVEKWWIFLKFILITDKRNYLLLCSVFLHFEVNRF